MKEVEELRHRLAQRQDGEQEYQPNCDEDGNPILYTEKDLQAKLTEDRESVQQQLAEFQTTKKKLKKEEDNRRAFSEMAKKKEEDCKALQRMFDQCQSELKQVKEKSSKD